MKRLFSLFFVSMLSITALTKAAPIQVTGSLILAPSSDYDTRTHQLDPLTKASLPAVWIDITVDSKDAIADIVKEIQQDLVNQRKGQYHVAYLQVFDRSGELVDLTDPKLAFENLESGFIEILGNMVILNKAIAVK